MPKSERKLTSPEMAAVFFNYYYYILLFFKEMLVKNLHAAQGKILLLCEQSQSCASLLGSWCYKFLASSPSSFAPAIG